MKIRHLVLPVVFIMAFAVSGAAYAHDGDGYDGNNGHSEWPHHEESGKTHLSEEKRQLLHETMQKYFGKNRALFGQMHKLHEELHDVLKSEPFDRQAFMAISAQLEKTHDRIHKIRTEAFASIAAQFTPEEREMLARHHGHHHGGGHHDGEWRNHSMNDGQTSQQENDQNYPPYPSR